MGSKESIYLFGSLRIISIVVMFLVKHGDSKAPPPKKKIELALINIKTSGNGGFL